MWGKGFSQCGFPSSLIACYEGDLNMLRWLVYLLDYPMFELHQQDAFHRLINACLRKLPILQRLFERRNHRGHLRNGIRPFDQVIPGDDRQRGSLVQCPVITDSLHVETVGDHHAVLVALVGEWGSGSCLTTVHYRR